MVRRYFLAVLFHKRVSTSACVRAEVEMDRQTKGLPDIRLKGWVRKPKEADAVCFGAEICTALVKSERRQPGAVGCIE